MADKALFLEQVSANLNHWQERIAELSRSISRVHTRELIEFERQLDLLSAKHDLAKEKLRLLHKVESDSDWQALKVSLDGICNEIENAIDSAWAKLNDS